MPRSWPDIFHTLCSPSPRTPLFSGKTFAAIADLKANRRQTEIAIYSHYCSKANALRGMGFDESKRIRCVTMARMQISFSSITFDPLLLCHTMISCLALYEVESTSGGVSVALLKLETPLNCHMPL